MRQSVALHRPASRTLTYAPGMPEHDLTDRVTEQLGPIVEAVQSRIDTPLTDRDKAAIAHGLASAAIMGARVATASFIANAAEAGVDLPFSTAGLRDEDLWPFED